jgi:hypothetical protein
MADKAMNRSLKSIARFAFFFKHFSVSKMAAEKPGCLLKKSLPSHHYQSIC